VGPVGFVSGCAHVEKADQQIPTPNTHRPHPHSLVVRVEGLGEGRAIVDGRERGHRFMRIGRGASVELSHLRLQHFAGMRNATSTAAAAATAAVLNEGTLRAYRCVPLRPFLIGWALACDSRFRVIRA
jgi:hypothetical protein